MTTIEWLVEQLPIRIINSYQDEIKKAKEMHKQEIIDAWEDGQHSFSSRNAEQYYQETFEKD